MCARTGITQDASRPLILWGHERTLTHTHLQTHRFSLSYTIPKNITAYQRLKMMKRACKTWASVAIVFYQIWHEFCKSFYSDSTECWCYPPPQTNWHKKVAHMQEGKKKRGGAIFGRFWRRSSSLVLFEDEAGRLRVNQMFHFTVNINLARAAHRSCSKEHQRRWATSVSQVIDWKSKF